MNDDINEALAQLQHENLKLLNELNYLKQHTLSLEETLNSQCSELFEEKKCLKSLSQQNNHLSQIIKEKDQTIDLLEEEKKHLSKVNSELFSEKLSLKGELVKEKLKNKQLEALRSQEEEELKKACAKLKQENQRLNSELSLKSEECCSSAAAVKDLQLQIKELQKEKMDLLAMRDTLLLQDKEEQLKTSENLESFSRKSPEWSTSQTNLYSQSEQNSISPPSKEKINLNLCQEILEVEVREKQIKIGQLESILRIKEEEELKRNQTIEELIRKLSHAGLSNYNPRFDLNIDSSAFYDIYRSLLRLLSWPEGHSGECKALTEVASLSIVVKDGVQAIQPSSIRIIETVSIASQTDPVKNLSPVLLFKSFEKLQSDHLSFDSEDEGEGEGEESPGFIEDRLHKDLQLFTESKNCNLDMDIYRSCRKLSVLPEEDIDESFNRKSSLKRPSDAKFYSFNSKTQSADDIINITSNKLILKGTSSYSNITSKNCKVGENNSFELLRKNNSCDVNVKKTVKENSREFNSKKDYSGEVELAILSPKDALRQPRSFDSYLDPIKAPSSPLARQISDPTQNTGFAPSVTRRGSYIRRPKSTCRPLTLPCEKSEKKKEDRIYKVRFDLNEIPFKKEDGLMEKEFNSTPILSSNKKIKIVSRFKVEIIDEVEFRKSLEENSRSTIVNRKRPPLVHSVHKKSALRDLTNLCEKNDLLLINVAKPSNLSVESPDSPVYDTAPEGSPSESFDLDSLDSNCTINDLYPMKRRRQSDISCNSFEDSQDSSEGNDILVKSIKLHTNSDCLIMKELKEEWSSSSDSNADSEIPFIDAEDLPVIKPSPDAVKLDPGPEILFSEMEHLSVVALSTGSFSESSDTYFTPSDVTPVSENNEPLTLGPPKSFGLSKSPTVLKNLANFELLAAISESRKLMQSEAIEEENAEEERLNYKSPISLGGKRNSEETLNGKVESDSLIRTSSDISEASESDTLTYNTVKSHTAGSSDYDSDTYVTVWSDKSFGLERKFSDLSENSSSPYNTPPDTSSASFCTPPDTYSPIFNSLSKHSGINIFKSYRSLDNDYGERNDKVRYKLDTPGSSPPPHKPCKLLTEIRGSHNRIDTEGVHSLEQNKNANHNIIFDSPKLEFYETNDSVENLEAFLQTEEGLQFNSRSEFNKKPSNSESGGDDRFLEMGEFSEAYSKQNNPESPKLSERRGKKHPPLSRQNSTEEYIFLDLHDSCLNLSEEFSSPSTTPDTSNKTVIFRNIPLTVSNTFDLEDDFSTSETEVIVNFEGSQTDILKAKGETKLSYTEGVHCLSEPCTPSISSADFLDFSVPRKQRSSFTDASLVHGKSEVHLPEIIVSNLSSESENSEFDEPSCAEVDFAPKKLDRSEAQSSDVNLSSGHSDNSCSLSEHSDNVISDIFSSDSEKSNATSRKISPESSSSRKTLSIENISQDIE